MTNSARARLRAKHRAQPAKTRGCESDNHSTRAATNGLHKFKAAKAVMAADVSALGLEQHSPHLSLTDATDRCRQMEAGNRRPSSEVELLMVELLPRLRRFAHSLTRDTDLSEDLVQETCVRALAHMDQYRPNTRLDSWMYRIAQNLWIDQLRAQSVRGENVSIAAVRNLFGCDGRVVTESRLSLLELRQCIAKLPINQKLLLHLICVDGLSYKEAAETLDWTIGRVMSRLARVRLALHAATARQPARPSDLN
jgi:RNA polymerase sigma-70 factor, ECF subfamily